MGDLALVELRDVTPVLGISLREGVLSVSGARKLTDKDSAQRLRSERMVVADTIRVGAPQHRPWVSDPGRRKVKIVRNEAYGYRASS